MLKRKEEDHSVTTVVDGVSGVKGVCTTKHTVHSSQEDLSVVQCPRGAGGDPIKKTKIRSWGDKDINIERVEINIKILISKFYTH